MITCLHIYTSATAKHTINFYTGAPPQPFFLPAQVLSSLHLPLTSYCPKICDLYTELINNLNIQPILLERLLFSASLYKYPFQVSFYTIYIPFYLYWLLPCIKFQILLSIFQLGFSLKCHTIYTTLYVLQL